jgi:hypothetical protein
MYSAHGQSFDIDAPNAAYVNNVMGGTPERQSYLSDGAFQSLYSSVSTYPPVATDNGSGLHASLLHTVAAGTASLVEEDATQAARDYLCVISTLNLP